MTPEERAEKLVNDESWGAYDYRKLEKLIAAQIKEAVDLAVDEALISYQEDAVKTNAKMVAEAYENAAKIADLGPGPGAMVEVDGDVRDPGAVATGYLRWVARKIRALKDKP